MTLNGRNALLLKRCVLRSPKKWMKIDPYCQRQKCRSMILVSRIKGISGYSLGFLGERSSNDSGVVDDDSFRLFRWLTSSEILEIRPAQNYAVYRTYTLIGSYVFLARFGARETDAVPGDATWCLLLLLLGGLLVSLVVCVCLSLSQRQLDIVMQMSTPVSDCCDVVHYGWSRLSIAINSNIRTFSQPATVLPADVAQQKLRLYCFHQWFSMISARLGGRTEGTKENTI